MVQPSPCAMSTQASGRPTPSTPKEPIMAMTQRRSRTLGITVLFASVLTATLWAAQPRQEAQGTSAAPKSFDEEIRSNAERMLEEGKQIFRFDTFGSEDFWGG